MVMDNSKYIEYFFSEAEELITNLNRQLVLLEKDYSDASVIDEIFRITHTIKGNAAAVGFGNISTFSHSLEDIFAQIRNGKLKFTSDIADIVFRALDELADLIECTRKDGSEPENLPEIIHQLHKIVGIKRIEEPGKDVEQGIIERVKKPKSISKKVVDRDIKLSENVRIPIKDLDSMLNLIGEIIIDVSKLGNLNRTLHNWRLKDINSHLRRILSDLQYEMMNVRLLDLASIFDQFPRLVRDIGSSEHKNVELVIEGEHIELDSKVIEKLKNPLIHIIRNSVSHGVELPDVRKRMGKSEKGLVKIEASRAKERVQIKVFDDGIGIDPIIVAGKAVELGLITEEQANEFSDDEILELIFEPGFTTSEQTSEVSGRGVGMDVVRSELSTIGGTVSIESVRNKGTTFTIDVPLSIAVIKALLCDVAGKTMIIPSSVIEELVEVERNKIQSISGQPHILLDENLIPIYDVGKMLYDEPIKLKGDKVELVITRSKTRNVALWVDKFIREDDIVVKSFWIPADVRSISGATILGNGKVALILDPYETIKLISLKEGGE